MERDTHERALHKRELHTEETHTKRGIRNEVYTIHKERVVHGGSLYIERVKRVNEGAHGGYTWRRVFTEGWTYRGGYTEDGLSGYIHRESYICS